MKILLIIIFLILFISNMKYINKPVYYIISSLLLLLILVSNVSEGFHQDEKVCNLLYVKENNKKYHVIPKLLSNAMCKSIIDEAEDYADISGWTTDRHDNYPTTDNEVTNDWNTYNYISNHVHNKIFKEVERMYNINSYELGINEFFVAKYQNKKNKQSSLDSHVDGSEFSFIIALNDDYEGGGTYFTELDETIKLKTGDCLIFSGQNRHKGVKVTTGTRYILTGFMNYKSYKYCHDYLNKDIE